jgi:hypothetical protein
LDGTTRFALLGHLDKAEQSVRDQYVAALNQSKTTAKSAAPAGASHTSSHTGSYADNAGSPGAARNNRDGDVLLLNTTFFHRKSSKPTARPTSALIKREPTRSALT